MYTPNVIQDLFASLEPKNDWSMRDHALKEISDIACSQPLILTDLTQFF